MDDMIQRQAALDALGNIDCSDGVGFSALKYDAINDAVTAIKALPSAQPGWIPWDKNTRNNMAFTLQTVLAHGDMDAIDEDNIKRLSRWLRGGEP